MDASYDVVVVGGGVAGTYAAWRLLTGDVSPTSGLPQAPADRSVALFELSDRIGGRLESLIPPGTPSLRAEFGGMGFTALNKILNGLVKYFKLKAVQFPTGQGQNLIYTRGVRFPKSQANDPQVVPYRLEPSEQGKIPPQLIVDAIEAVLPGASGYSPEKWREVKRDFIYDGRHLNELGFWNFLSQNMSHEAFAYACDGIGHFFQVANWNCAEALPWFLGDGTAGYQTLANGYDELPLTVFNAFTSAGGKISMSTEVVAVHQVTTGPQGETTMEVRLADGTVVTANAVVLALPRRALERLGDDTVVLSEPPVHRMVESVTGQQVMKIFCCYEQAWWSESPLNITLGNSATDLPLGNVWYFGPDTSTGNALLLASYNDTLATTYWAGLKTGPRYVPPGGTADVDPHWVDQAPSDIMIEEVQRQVAELHGLATIPAPYSAAFRDWTEDPYGGAFNTWNVGIDAETIARKMVQPDDAVPLYVCGEAYSHDQGWAEGALDTAEQVVKKLGVGPAAWLGS